MLKIQNLNVSLVEEKKQILKNINLIIKSGEVHLLTGRNGSGKSSLVNTVMGNPQFEISSGSIILEEESYPQHIVSEIEEDLIQKSSNKKYDIDLTEAEPNERSLLGIYLANQYPPEIPGVSLSNYLRIIYNVRKPEKEKLPVFKFRKIIEEKAALIDYPKELLMRNLNEGFSGGEKKKTEILQMLITEPRYVMLDEIDSGLDKQSVVDVFQGLSKFKKQSPQTSFIVITHYDRVQEFLPIDKTYEMEKGEIG
jgi:Fe-S cluster assembly ATP-binding protein